MSRRIIFLLFVVATLFLSLQGASAQSCKGQVSCAWYSNNSGCLPTLPPTAEHCTDCGPWCAVCDIQNASCAPADAPKECTRCSRAQGGKPIDLTTGNTYIEETDIRVPGLGGGLTLMRTWNSKLPPTQSASGGGSSGSGSSGSSGGSGVGSGSGASGSNPSAVGLFGLNWRSNFEERVFAGSDGYMKYARGDGSVWSFGYANGVYAVAAPANETASLAQGSTDWTLTLQNGEKHLFDNGSGNLVAIIDRNGNTTQLTYDASLRLTSVIDPAGQHLYFSYGSASSYLVSSVTSDVGLSLTYAYDSSQRLTTVTKPDQATLSFDYDGNSFIADVKDSNGTILESHTYDSQGRGLTSSRANGIDAITVSYPKPAPPVITSN